MRRSTSFKLTAHYYGVQCTSSCWCIYSDIHALSPLQIIMAVAKKNCDEMEISGMKPSNSATVHGMIIGNLSPIKTSRKSQFFEGNLSDGARMISFQPSLRTEMEQIKDSGDSVKLSNCCIQHSKLSGEFEIALNSRSNVLKSPKKYAIDDSAASGTVACDIANISALSED